MPIIDPVCSSDSIWRGTNMNRSISDDLDALETSVSALQSGGEHDHDDVYAGINHGHTDLAPASHTHSYYAPTGHTHTDLAAANHTHTDLAAANHNHDTSYAGVSHDHDGDYLPASGDVNVVGVLRVQGNQAFYYNTAANTQTMGTNNATGGTHIACGASADVTINGANTKVPNVVPRTHNAFTLGTSSVRWKGIYSTAAVSVSSDRRLKRDIGPVDGEALANFVNALPVVAYNYNDDPEGQKARIGLIAQDVQDVDPELAEFFVNEGDNGYLNLAPADLVFALIATVQELRKEIDMMKAQM